MCYCSTGMANCEGKHPTWSRGVQRCQVLHNLQPICCQIPPCKNCLAVLNVQQALEEGVLELSSLEILTHDHDYV